MRIADRLREERPSFSFEFFPPKDDAGVEQLFEAVGRLERLSPAFVSVTWGAGGGTRRMTIDLVKRIHRETGVEAMAHLTCVGATRQELGNVLGELDDAGITNVLALRGDPPRGETAFVRPADGFGYASELVAFIRERERRGGARLCIGGACYPETHVEAASAESDLLHLREKADAGAEFFVTQLFFDNRRYFDFVARARAAGVRGPIVPGIMPITNLAQVERMSRMCGASIPEALHARLAAVGDAPDAVREVGVAHAIAQCRELLLRGAPGIHFYTLNRSRATASILEALAELR